MSETAAIGISIIGVGLGLCIAALAWHVNGLNNRLIDLEEKVNEVRKDRRRG